MRPILSAPSLSPHIHMNEDADPSEKTLSLHWLLEEIFSGRVVQKLVSAKQKPKFDQQ